MWLNPNEKDILFCNHILMNLLIFFAYWTFLGYDEPKEEFILHAYRLNNWNITGKETKLFRILQKEENKQSTSTMLLFPYHVMYV